MNPGDLRRKWDKAG